MSSKKEVTDILKGITARMASQIRRRAEAEARAAEVEPATGPFSAEPIHAQETHNAFEPPRIYKSVIGNLSGVYSPGAATAYASCTGCGYMHKSTAACPRCEATNATNVTAKPIWRR